MAPRSASAKLALIVSLKNNECRQEPFHWNKILYVYKILEKSMLSFEWDEHN